MPAWACSRVVGDSVFQSDDDLLTMETILAEGWNDADVVPVGTFPLGAGSSLKLFG